MSADRTDTQHDDLVRQTAAPIGGEEPGELPDPKYRDAEADPDDVVAARREQEREMATAGSTVGPLGAVVTDAQGRGAWVGAVVGGAIGAVLMLLVGLLPLVDLDLGARLLVFGIVGLMGGVAAGAVFGGGRMAELEGEASDVADDPRDRTRAR